MSALYPCFLLAGWFHLYVKHDEVQSQGRFTGFQQLMESEAFTQNFALIMVVAHFANRALKKVLARSFIILENHQEESYG